MIEKCQLCGIEIQEKSKISRIYMNVAEFEGRGEIRKKAMNNIKISNEREDIQMENNK